MQYIVQVKSTIIYNNIHAYTCGYMSSYG
jgi:hypothetical protein